jgi:hypothetical protein
MYVPFLKTFFFSSQFIRRVCSNHKYITKEASEDLLMHPFMFLFSVTLHAYFLKKILYTFVFRVNKLKSVGFYALCYKIDLAKLLLIASFNSTPLVWNQGVESKLISQKKLDCQEIN